MGVFHQKMASKMFVICFDLGTRIKINMNEYFHVLRARIPTDSKPNVTQIIH